MMKLPKYTVEELMMYATPCGDWPESLVRMLYKKSCIKYATALTVLRCGDVETLDALFQASRMINPRISIWLSVLTFELAAIRVPMGVRKFLLDCRRFLNTNIETPHDVWIQYYKCKYKTIIDVGNSLRECYLINAMFSVLRFDTGDVAFCINRSMQNGYFLDMVRDLWIAALEAST